MSQNLRDFVNWFDGISAILGDKPPSKQQWGMIVKRMAAMKTQINAEPDAPAHAPAPQATAAVDPGVDPDPRGTVIVQKWKQKALLALEEVYDHGDAVKILETRIAVDLNSEPAEVVERFINST